MTNHEKINFNKMNRIVKTAENLDVPHTCNFIGNICAIFASYNNINLKSKM